MAQKNGSEKLLRQNWRHATIISSEVKNGQMTVRFRLSRRPHSRKKDKNVYSFQCAYNPSYCVLTAPNPDRWRM